MFQFKGHSRYITLIHMKENLKIIELQMLYSSQYSNLTPFIFKIIIHIIMLITKSVLVKMDACSYNHT